MTTAQPLPGISIFGLDDVGVVTAACFAQRGHQVVGVSTRDEKVSRNGT